MMIFHIVIKQIPGYQVFPNGCPHKCLNCVITTIVSMFYIYDLARSEMNTGVLNKLNTIFTQVVTKSPKIIPDLIVVGC